MAILIFVLLCTIPAILGQSCPTVVCDKTGKDDVCARITDEEIIIDECDNGEYVCNLADVVHALAQPKTLGEDILIKCTVQQRKKFSMGEHAAEAVAKSLCERRDSSITEKKVGDEEYISCSGDYC
jgi:hypothetical protein